MMINGSHNVCILFITQHCGQCRRADMITETFLIIAIVLATALSSAPAIVVVIVLVPHLSLSLVI